MPERLMQAIEEAKSGTTFMKSSLAQSSLSADEVNLAHNYVNRHPDSSSYILLMALRKQGGEAYDETPDKTKAEVLCAGLANLTFLNDFGHLEPSSSYDGKAAQALLDIGQPALSCLQALLANHEDAPLFGSKDATASSVFHYRRADFAYRYIMLILGQEPTFPADPAERDRLITDLQAQLKKEQAPS